MIEECKRLTLCVDCDDKKCWNHGKLIADCPKPKCDRPEYAFEHCESCAFLKRFQDEMRKLYHPYRSEKNMKIKCSKCGKEFEVGNRPDGLPNGIGIPMEDGRVVNVCTDCIVGTDPVELAECGESPLYNPYSDEVLTPFCPWCGAEMEVE